MLATTAVFVGSFLFFATIRALIWYMSLLPPAVSKSGKKVIIWRWYNVFVSCLHAMLAGSASLFSIYNNPNMITNLADCDSTFAFMLVTASTAYFLYDLVDTIVGCQATSSLAVLTHHIVVIFCFSIVVRTGVYVPYAVCCLLVEVNSVFLHLRQLMRMAKFINNLFYTVNMLANLVTFVIFRFVSLGWLAWWTWISLNDIAQPYSTVLVTTVPLMYGINIGLLLQVLEKDGPILSSLFKSLKSCLCNGWSRCQSHNCQTTCMNTKMLRD